MKNRSITLIYIVACMVLGAVVMVHGYGNWQPADLVRFGSYFSLAMFASLLKVRLPGVTGTMSVNYLFILLGIAELSLGEVMVIGLASTVLQTFWNTKRRPKIVQLGFNLASMAISIGTAYRVHILSQQWMQEQVLVSLTITAAVYFLVNTFSVAIVISLSEGKPLMRLWKQCYFWSFAYYLAGASMVAVMTSLNAAFGWQMNLLPLPVLYLLFRSYRVYLDRLEGETRHAGEMADLHMRTIEALALAIEAKDESTHDHLGRVQHYAVEIGKEMNLPEEQLAALKAAAVLHDIGKLAVPEHIISKPGKLTPEEFEKMKIHPTVGAQILERVKFPYPVVPIVRAHHEKWDGSGYPNGLQKEGIPLGARILAVVDCLDALSSDRQYRRALPMEEAMRFVASESGKSFDPAVVNVLQRRYLDLADDLACDIHREKLETNLLVEKGLAPAAGFEQAGSDGPETDPVAGRLAFLSSIASARHEAQVLFELSNDLGSSLSLPETLSVLDLRLKKTIPYHTMVVYVLKGDRLVTEYAQGDNFQMFSSLEIPVGEGLSGWVAENSQSVINGNPAVEYGYLSDPTRFTKLRSALAMPLTGPGGTIGVLALYHKQEDAFCRDHLRVLTAVGSKIALVVQNALRFREVEKSATADGLTGLPNATSLFLHLDSELSRSKRAGTPLTVLVCDLDGFKKINDSYGHLEGNRLLKMVADTLRDCCREYDYVSRMGGDEFVLVLPETNVALMRQKIRSITRAVERIGLEVCGEKLVSISIGEASYPDNGVDAEELLAEADRRMYQAKQSRKPRGREATAARFDEMDQEPSYQVQ